MAARFGRARARVDERLKPKNTEITLLASWHPINQIKARTQR